MKQRGLYETTHDEMTHDETTGIALTCIGCVRPPLQSHAARIQKQREEEAARRAKAAAAKAEAKRKEEEEAKKRADGPAGHHLLGNYDGEGRCVAASRVSMPRGSFPSEIGFRGLAGYCASSVANASSRQGRTNARHA